MFIAYFDSPVGCLRVVADENAVTAVEFVDAAGEDTCLSPLVSQCLAELSEYFAGSRHTFSVPLAPQGTEFQVQVWNKLVAIPFGRKVSYTGLATQLGDRNKLRAVGGANHVNPIAILIPCHRVVGADRSLVGYGGGLWRKRWLLEHEQSTKEGTRTIALTAFI
jgi:methylated-DNA-[protein]-cysteine S-methyltransferase